MDMIDVALDSRCWCCIMTFVHWKSLKNVLALEEKMHGRGGGEIENHITLTNEE